MSEETIEQKQAREMAEAAWLTGQPIHLPQGTTGLPERSDIDPTWSRGNIQTGPQPTAEQEAVGIANLHLMSTDSQFLGRPILNFLDIWEHLQLEQAGAEPLQPGKRGRPRKTVDTAAEAAKEAQRATYKQWVQDCQDRKARIHAAKVELDSRKRACAAYIKEVQDALDYWESTPVPKRP